MAVTRHYDPLSIRKQSLNFTNNQNNLSVCDFRFLAFDRLLSILRSDLQDAQELKIRPKPK
ncbi:2736_t:CDS:2 [Cetraspora pellucida]|uniref:2736_t:CDS:1 n=1 Tax=Cetraspora pellucida TaxID=1433469 RepID=A0A9N9N5D9_9GLOM|nr:2736_t:CDS:2 [Cetraspora pellucida]